MWNSDLDIHNSGSPEVQISRTPINHRIQKKRGVRLSFLLEETEMNTAVLARFYVSRVLPEVRVFAVLDYQPPIGF